MDMSLEDRKHAHMQRMLKMILLFAVLGCIVLVIAINYVSKVLTDALPPGMQ